MADVNLPASHLAMTDDERRLLSLFRSLTGSDAFDAEEAIPRFAYGAAKAASEQGNLAMWDIKFSARYISGWRWELVRSIRESAAAPDEYRQQEG